MTLCYDRGCVYNNSSNFTEETCKRYKGIRLIDCPFELYAARYNRIWRLKIHNANYNYDCSEDISGHPIIRRLTEPQLETVAAMTVAGSRP